MKEYSILIMNSKELKRDVKIYVYLPSDYNKTQKSYSTLYMTDGQIIFKDYDDYNGTEWGIIQDYMSLPIADELILIGIGSNENRNDELFPFSFKSRKDDSTMGGKADDTMKFITTELIPIINNKYRTIKSPERTGILGISVGGTFAMYAASKYTEFFSRFACISTASIPIQNALVKHLENCSYDNVNKLYQDVGTNESPNENARAKYVSTNQEISEVFKRKISSSKYRFDLIEGSQHIEEDWNERIGNIITLIFS